MAIAFLHYGKADARKNDGSETGVIQKGINDLSDVQTRE
jgi:hypothetical protein